MLRQAKRAWFIRNSGREFDRYSWFLLVCPVNRLNSPLVEHLDDLFNIGTSLLVFLVLHGASSGMYHVDLHFLKTIQLFQHPLVRGGIFVTAIAEEKRGKNYLLIRIAGKSFGLIAQCFRQPDPVQDMLVFRQRRMASFFIALTQQQRPQDTGSQP